MQGAGASFPAPLYNKWFKSYGASHPDVEVDYQSVGSGSGKKSVIDQTVDFGASDAAMTDEEMARVQGGVQLLPMTAGAIVIAYNVDGVTNLKLSRKAYTGIFLGKIKKWNDPAIAAANPGAKLPDLPINVVVRADGSGTSYVFSKHLSAVSEEFNKAVGTNTMPNWPVGTKSKGNEGVTASLKTTPGSIGYVEYGYAKSQKLTIATLENKAGKYVAASTASGQAALASVDSAGQPDRLGFRSGRSRRLPDRHLHLVDLLPEVSRRQEACGVAGSVEVQPDRRTEGRRSAGLHSAACQCYQQGFGGGTDNHELAHCIKDELMASNSHVAPEAGFGFGNHFRSSTRRNHSGADARAIVG